MIYKYNVQSNTIFHDSIMLPLFEQGHYGFEIQGLLDDDLREVFSTKKIKINNKKEIDISALSKLEVVYLDDHKLLKAFVIYCPTTKKYYFFRHEEGLIYKTQNNYIDTHLEIVVADYEKRRTRKKEFGGLGEYELIQDLDYFEDIFFAVINKIDNEPNGARIIFSENSYFAYAFIDGLTKGNINIINKDRLVNNVISIDSMNKAELRYNRKDCVYVNYDIGDIEYFIFTSRYKSSNLNHYFLFKKISENTFEYLIEDVSFNKVFSFIKQATSFKDLDTTLSKGLIHTEYEDFYAALIQFQDYEEIDEDISSLIDALLTESDEEEKQESTLGKELISLFDGYSYKIKDNSVIFEDYESFPLLTIGEGWVKFKKNRMPKDEAFTNQISFKDTTKLKKSLVDLLQGQPSSRILSFEQKVKNISLLKYNPDSKEQIRLINDIEDAYLDMQKTDKRYPEGYLNKIYQSFNNWKSIFTLSEDKKPEKEQFASSSQRKSLNTSNVYVSEHASLRINERIEPMNDEQQLVLAIKAYETGVQPIDFIDKQDDVFECMHYLQNKKPGKTLRLFNNIIFIFGLQEPHALVTVYPFEESLKRYRNVRNKRLKKKK